MPRFVVAIAVVLSLMLAPYVSVSNAVTRQQESSQRDESPEEHKENEKEKESEESEASANRFNRRPLSPLRVLVDIIDAPPAASALAGSVAPSLHPAKLSVRRLI